MSSVSQRSDTRKKKELKVLELHEQGYSYRKIAKEVHLSLRDVTQYINLALNKTKSQSSTSIHDEVVLEYRVNGLRHEVTDLESRKESLNNELNDLRAQKYNLQIQLRARQSELDVVKRDLENERFSKEVLEIFNEGK
jgi:predicted  nucleic acid-binding Zn-ribbon protein